MNKEIFIGIGIIIITISFLLLTISHLKTSKQTINSDILYEDIVSNNFTLKTTYNDNNTWTYILTGTIPNPCYNISIEEVVMESYPEQVNINVKVFNSNPDIMCTQVIQEIEETGTLQASQSAKISLNIENE